MPAPREFPYIWTTWLPRLLTGENSCEWAIWFKAPHQNWAKPPSDFNQAQWMLNERRSNWEVSGYSVEVEGRNGFQLRGRSATLSGKPDIIAHRDDEAVIVDAKTGHESPSHIVQVMIYLYAIPRALERYRTLKLRGQATYLDHTIQVPAEAVDDQFIQNLGALIRQLAADKPRARVPSPRECRFCDISAPDCPERVDEGSEPEGRTTTDFCAEVTESDPLWRDRKKVHLSTALECPVDSKGREITQRHANASKGRSLRKFRVSRNADRLHRHERYGGHSLRLPGEGH